MSAKWEADERGFFGDGTSWGGRFMPEALVAALDELTVAWQDAMADPSFTQEDLAAGGAVPDGVAGDDLLARPRW